MLTRVRIGTFSDINAAAGIWERAHRQHDAFTSEPARKDRALAFLASHAMRPVAEFLVAEFNAEIVGMLFASQGREHDGAGAPVPRLLHVSYVAVDPAHWSHGIATSLLGQLVRQAEEKGYECLQLWVEARNERALIVYEHYGLAFRGREKVDDYGHPILLYAMKIGPS
jgi:ribosomal protein S18 acetylase RimI-like enzyme